MQLPRTDSPNFQTTDLSKCSSFNVQSHNTKNLFPQNTNRYCLSGNNDTILNFTKKDLIYLNELINNNNADEKILQEKNIIAPQEIRENQTFCPDQTKTIFWPDVTDPNEMCQEEKVVAIAKIPKGGLNGEFWYLDANKKIHKSAPIIFTHHNPNNLDRFTGELTLTDEIKQTLN